MPDEPVELEATGTGGVKIESFSTDESLGSGEELELASGALLRRLSGSVGPHGSANPDTRTTPVETR